MEKIVIPSDLQGKALYKFLVDNKNEIIKQKKSIIKKFDAPSCIPSPSIVSFIKGGKSVKAEQGQALAPEDATSVFVKMVANSCNWVDSDMDLLIDNCAKKTIQQRKGLIVHLKDHIHETDAQVGDVQDVYLADVSLRDLGVNKTGTTQCIIMESIVQKSYYPRIFDMYRQGKIKQHSIGLLYMKIELAVNDEEWEKEKDFWNKYYDRIINKEIVDERGYFWVVSEIKLLENSCVLFGANELTPTLEIGKSHSSQTAGKALDEESEIEEFDVASALKTIKFFKN